MREQLLSQIVPLIITCIIGILVVIIKAIKDAAIALIETKKQEIITKIGQAKYDDEMKMAKDIWNIVEEHFRINEVLQNVTEEKIKLFNKMLLEKIPYLKQSDIDYLRQAVAGQVNMFKQKVEVGTEEVEGTTTAPGNTVKSELEQQ